MSPLNEKEDGLYLQLTFSLHNVLINLRTVLRIHLLYKRPRVRL